MSSIDVARATALRFFPSWGAVVSVKTVAEPHSGRRYIMVKMERGYYFEQISRG